ncbi:hydroxypyruvate isomerase [bacterium]|nr:MAG: hydroxypyruvate isomerase [bacterium]
MPKLCANLSFLFTEQPMDERFAAAAAAGFDAVEFPSPYGHVDDYAERLREHALHLVLFNLPMGDFAAGERGFALDPARREEFREGVERALEAARALSCTRVNALVGIRKPELDERIMWQTAVENLRYAAGRLREGGITLMVEPLNAIDTPNFFIETTARALRLLDDIDAENVRLQFDCYHAQRGEGNLLATFARHVGRIGHVQIADSPDRHQPGTGELAYERILRAIDDAGYEGWVGLEYRPLGTTQESLRWIASYGFTSPA